MADTAESVTIRLWAGARAAAGVDTLDVVPRRPSRWPTSPLRSYVERPAARPTPPVSPGSWRSARSWSATVPLGTADRATTAGRAGGPVEFLPPFAGG